MPVVEVRLLPATRAILDAALRGDGDLADVTGCRVITGWATFRDALPLVRDIAPETAAEAAWGTQLFVIADPGPSIVGWGGYRGPPARGSVEIGYEIAASHRRRGLATAAATALTERAFAAPEVTVVIAHTEPQDNPSNRLLGRLGFRYAGAVTIDGDMAWRYVRMR